jgi:hypothetical protein
VSLSIQAIRRGSENGWHDAVVFRARALDSAFRTAARKLGLRSEQWLVNVATVRR